MYNKGHWLLMIASTHSATIECHDS